jgi:excisionase family DNA binding protein
VPPLVAPAPPTRHEDLLAQVPTEAAPPAEARGDVVNVEIVTAEEFVALEARVGELEAKLAATQTAPESPYMTIPEAAVLMRCSRQRIDDLLTARVLERVKDGSRTLLRRADVLRYLEDGANGRRRR